MNIEQLLDKSLDELEAASDEQIEEWCRPFMEYVRPVTTAKSKSTKSSPRAKAIVAPPVELKEVDPRLTTTGMSIMVQNTMLSVTMAAGLSRKQAIEQLVKQLT